MADRKPPISTCDPNHPTTDGAAISIYVSARGNTLSITATDQACKSSRARTYTVTAEDDESFILPMDLAPATLAMLNGISLRFMQLARYGFDREP